MITDYYRPKTLAEALKLLEQANTIPLGGGTAINSPEYKNQEIAVVDLQALGLNEIRKQDHFLEIDACVTLEQLQLHAGCPVALSAATKLDSPLNVRNLATVAGALTASNGRSTFACAMLALDAKLMLDGDADKSVRLGEFLPLRSLPGRLITKIIIPLNCQLSFEQVAKTPADRPLVCAALAQWSSGRTRLALGGFGKSATLALDGTEEDGVEEAARNACHEAADDIASAEYRADVAAVLAKRCLDAVKQFN